MTLDRSAAPIIEYVSSRNAAAAGNAGRFQSRNFRVTGIWLSRGNGRGKLRQVPILAVSAWKCSLFIQARPCISPGRNGIRAAIRYEPQRLPKVAVLRLADCMGATLYGRDPRSLNSCRTTSEPYRLPARRAASGWLR